MSWPNTVNVAQAAASSPAGPPPFTRSQPLSLPLQATDFYDIVIHYFLCLHRKPVNGHRRGHIYIYFKIILISVDEIGRGPRGTKEGKENVRLAEEKKCASHDVNL